MRSPISIPWSEAFCASTAASPEPRGSRPATGSVGLNAAVGREITRPGAPNVSTTSPSTTRFPRAVSSPSAAFTPLTRRTWATVFSDSVGGSDPRLDVNFSSGLTITSRPATDSFVIAPKALRIWSVSM